MSSPPPSLPSEPEAEAGPTETVIYVVRHAHAVWQLDEQHHLSPGGRADAERLADLLEKRDIGAIYASPYPRAAQTVEPLADRLGLPVRTEPELSERRLSARRVPDFEAAVRWAWEHPEDALPGGESNRHALARVGALIDRLTERHPGEAIVLATHGSLMALLFHHLDPRFGLDDWAQMTMPDVYRIAGGRPERVWKA